VVAAHPDDETLGCGATIAKHASRGDMVFIHILGEGAMSRQNAERTHVDSLREFAVEAGKVLGAQGVVFENLPDNRFDTVALLTVVQKVESVIDRFRPQIVYTHDPGDLNIDHKLTYQAVLTATRPCAALFVKEVFSFEVPSASEWQFEPAFAPNVFVSVSPADMEKKIEALACYKSEIREAPYPRSPEIIRALARVRGSAVMSEYAEAFRLVRKI